MAVLMKYLYIYQHFPRMEELGPSQKNKRIIVLIQYIIILLQDMMPHWKTVSNCCKSIYMRF